MLNKALKRIGAKFKRRKKPPAWDTNEVFKNFYEEIKPRTLVSADRCFMLYQLSRLASLNEGALAEIGVYKGGTARLLSNACPKRQLHLFDTFEGMPDTDAGVDIHKKGDFADTSLEAVQSFLSDRDNVVYHPGFFPETAKGLEDERFSFVYIDTDIYKSIVDCLEFFYPRTVRGGIIVLDDYEWRDCPGVKKAIDEFLQDKKEIPVVTAQYQCMLIKQGDG